MVSKITMIKDNPKVVGGNRKWNPAANANWIRANNTESIRVSF
jgi:hypothetical protein